MTKLWQQADLLAGLTVGVMTVPQALSYARIAGLPSEYGLYGAFTPVLAYAVFGSSPQLVRVQGRVLDLQLGFAMQTLSRS